MTDTMTTQSMPSDDDPAARAAAEVFGIPYPFPWQRLIIAAVLDAAAPLSCGRERGGGSVSGGSSELYPPAQAQAGRQALRRIAVLPTGAGKSLCWMLPAVLIDGITVAVFPLLALMSDQQRRLREAGVPTVMLRGGQTVSERAAVWRALENGDAKIVLANPEVLYAGGAARRLGALKPRFLVVDETHTVSQWGESFRPACAEMGRLVEAWNPPAVLALTATAGPRIRERISALLFNGESPSEALANPDRPAVRYGVLPSLSPMHTLERLVRDEARPAVVFGPTRSSVQRAARTLRGRLNDDNIRFYHAGLNRDEKQRLEEWFFSSRNGVLCATCAYGLGVDKPDIRTVIHLAPPSSVEAYLQESGRASRDGKGAAAWLIWQPHEAVNVLGDSAPASDGDRGCALSGQAAPEGDSAGPEADTQRGSACPARAEGAPKSALEAHSAGPRRAADGPKAALEAHSGGPRQAAANHPKPDNQGRRFSSGSQITPKNYPAKTGRPATGQPLRQPRPRQPRGGQPPRQPRSTRPRPAHRHDPIRRIHRALPPRNAAGSPGNRSRGLRRLRRMRRAALGGAARGRRHSGRPAAKPAAIRRRKPGPHPYRPAQRENPAPRPGALTRLRRPLRLGTRRRRRGPRRTHQGGPHRVPRLRPTPRPGPAPRKQTQKRPLGAAQGRRLHPSPHIRPISAEHLASARGMWNGPFQRLPFTGLATEPSGKR